MEGLLFLLFISVLIVYITILRSRTILNRQLEQYNSEIARKLKILVDNQLELNEMVMELKSGTIEESANLEDIDKIITDLEFEKIKSTILSKEEQEVEKTKNAHDEQFNFSKKSDHDKESILSELINNELDNEDVDTEEENLKLVKESVIKSENEQIEDDEEDEIIEINQIIEPKKDSKIKSENDNFLTEKRKSFSEQFPDLEKFIGENIINKIGIIITVIGIIFSVKYAIDNEYINEFGRVMIGIAAGGLLIGIAHRLRIKYSAFSSVLVGGGLATLYFTIGLAFQEYHIFSQTIAFVIMLVITIFAVLLSILYDRQELAVLAIIGGFATPLAVSTGAGNYKILFTYLALLNVGMLALAYFKKWRIVNIVSYFFTVFLFSAWLVDAVNKDKLPLKGSFFFASIFYFIFFFQNIIYNLKESKKFQAWEFFILLSNSFAYFGAGLYILHNAAPEFKGLFTALVAIFNFIFAFSLYLKSDIDRNLVYLLIGLVLSFVSLIAPIQLEGNYITLFWSAEAVILLWMWQKTEIQLIKLASVLVIAVMLFSLFMDWEKIYYGFENKHIMQIIINKGFLTGLSVLTSLLLSIYLLSKENSEFLFPNFLLKYYSSGLITIFISVLYLVLFFEISYHLKLNFEDFNQMNIILNSYNTAFLLVLVAWLTTRKAQIYNTLALIFGFIAILIYALYSLPVFANLRNAQIENRLVEFSPLVFHYISLALVLVLIGFNSINFKRANLSNEKLFFANIWFSVFYVLTILSVEIDNIILFTFYDHSSLQILEGNTEILYWQIDTYRTDILSQSHKIAFPVLWGVSSFILMVVGLRKDNRVLRIISLVVFFVTILKLFIIDVWDMAEGGRILAFVLLGVLLLIISFMYQKLKFLILDDENKNEKQKS